MRIVVTGGAGFIGSHVVDMLLDAGHEVVVIDDLSRGRRSNLPPNVDFFQLDIRDPGLTALLADLRPDVVNHHAAQVSVAASVKQPRFDAEVNILGSLNLLEACRHADVQKILYSSTGGAAVGEPDYVPVDETHPVAPLSPYGISKYTVEHYLRYFQLVYGLRYNVLRYPNVYGPRQDAEGEAGVIAIFARRMLADLPVTINGDGEQTRDFVHVTDIARANLAALDQADNGMFHLGSGSETSVNKIFGELARLTEYSRKPVYGPALPGEVRNISLDASLASRVLNWHAIISLEDGLANTVADMRQQMIGAM